jgi:hypothetical protein
MITSSQVTVSTFRYKAHIMTENFCLRILYLNSIMQSENYLIGHISSTSMNLTLKSFITVNEWI